MLDQALTQIPDAYRHGTPELIRTGGAGSTYGFLAHIRALREQGVDARFSVGAAITAAVRAAIEQATDWIPAIDADGGLRDAQICEITGSVDTDGFPAGTRLIARRERPHPGAQLSLFDTIAGMRHQVVATDTPDLNHRPAPATARRNPATRRATTMPTRRNTASDGHDNQDQSLM